MRNKRGEATIATIDRQKESLQEKKITLQQKLKRDRQQLQQTDLIKKEETILTFIICKTRFITDL